MPPVGIYIHIPFCLRKCPYCDFYSVAFETGAADAYTDALIRAMETRPFGRLQADTLYFGGGTPSLMGAERLGALVDAAGKFSGLSAGAEITLEANPGAILPGELRDLRKRGINRISFGVQSLLDSELAALGRVHTSGEAKEAVLAAWDAGFVHISADLMLGVPAQTRESLRESVLGLCALPLDHISAYLLKIEERTPFFTRYRNKKKALPDEDTAAGFYLDCVSLLGSQGFFQYEISNFAKHGAVSRHNLKYWRCEEYLGFGPAAHSFLGGRRFYFPPDLIAFCASATPFDLTVPDGNGGDLEESLLLGLRLTEGIDTATLQDRYGFDPRPLLSRAARPDLRGFVRVDGGRVSLTAEGFLLSNTVIGLLIEQVS